VIAALAVAVVAALVSPVAAHPRQTAGACAGDSGVTVVIDFQELGGGVNVVCAHGPVSSGLEALERAGVSYQTAQRSPGFVCRIADKPADDRCVNASPASAYWGYWIAAPGGAWCYSTIGAGSRKPPPGTFEGWSFSLDKVAAAIPPPRFAPPAATSNPPPTLNTSDCTSTPQTLPPPSTAATTTAASTPAATTTLRATTTGATAAPVTTAESTTAAPTSTTLSSTDPAPPTTAVDLGEDGGDGGSPIGFVVSAAVVIGVGAGSVMVVRRRRLRAPR
jgi:hypothetical protein